jgi:hypothetical protein
VIDARRLRGFSIDFGLAEEASAAASVEFCRTAQWNVLRASARQGEQLVQGAQHY